MAFRLGNNNVDVGMGGSNIDTDTFNLTYYSTSQIENDSKSEDIVIGFGKLKLDMLTVLDDKHMKASRDGRQIYTTSKIKDEIKKDDNDIFSSIIDLSRVNEAGYGTIQTAKPSNATIRASNNGNDQRDFTNAQQDAKRDSSNPQRYVAGSNKQATGQGAVRQSSNPDPDDEQRAQNAMQANVNAQEIERLKQLAMGGR